MDLVSQVTIVKNKSIRHYFVIVPKIIVVLICKSVLINEFAPIRINFGPVRTPKLIN